MQSVVVAIDDLSRFCHLLLEGWIVRQKMISALPSPVCRRLITSFGSRTQSEFPNLRTLTTPTVSLSRYNNVSSRVQADRSPATVFAGEEEAVVQAVFSVDPEFDLLRIDAVAFPIGGPGHFSRMLLGELTHLGFQLPTTA